MFWGLFIVIYYYKIFELKVTKLRMYLYILITSLLLGCTTYYKGPISDHFDGSRFFNKAPHSKSFWALLKLAFGGPSSDWPDSVPVTLGKIPQERVFSGVTYTVVGHATVLIQVDGLNILTDPIYSERASPVSFAGPKRVTAPAVAFEDLPDIDIVLVSHDHYDHMDMPTLQRLQNHNKSGEVPLIISGLGNDIYFIGEGFENYKVLDWGESIIVGEARIHFVECQHRSGRGVFDHKKTLWGSFAIESPSAKIYFAGDTGYSPHFSKQGEKFNGFDLSFIPVGAYEPRWFMKDVHVNPEEAVQAHQDLRSSKSVGIHFGTFKLTYEGMDEPEKELSKALEKAGLKSNDFVIPIFGKTTRMSGNK